MMETMTQSCYYSRRAAYCRTMAQAIDNLEPNMDRIERARAYRAEAIENDKLAKLAKLGAIR
jgi:hypothetical protein